MFREKCREFGIVLKTHGVKGELLLKTVFEISDNYNLAGAIFIEIDGLLVPFFLEEYTLSSSQTIIVKLSGIDNKNKALHFVDCKVFVENLKANKVKSDFSTSNLVGFSVIDQNGTNLGKIFNIMDIPGNFLVTVMSGKKEILLPFNEHVLIKFNRLRKQIVLNVLPGLTDL
ncbi:MAG: 16S rRNA processing protein RimM [Bacteroidetes bacterium CG23_combo_of_CG06-09_8_20_14_all_32_9]|nr:MAG: 16S rRNA processing protein RimM [Bacteroidetes bacterium CG23_combo_of_CG06-09_8_20_14_all_32_9]